jgi:hypothetical protein
MKLQGRLQTKLIKMLATEFDRKKKRFERSAKMKLQGQLQTKLIENSETSVQITKRDSRAVPR